MTRHYVLFHESATLHAMSEAELEERYLLWRSLENLTLQDVKDDFGLYAGAGPLKDQPRTENNRVLFCQKLARVHVKSECPQKTDTFALKGELYFETQVKHFAEVRAHQRDLLQKYHVAYLVVDTLHDTFLLPQPLEHAVYSDGRFFIFPIDEDFPSHIIIPYRE